MRSRCTMSSSSCARSAASGISSRGTVTAVAVSGPPAACAAATIRRSRFVRSLTGTRTVPPSRPSSESTWRPRSASAMRTRWASRPLSRGASSSAVANDTATTA
ncbi:Uncharacterised protein [Mycobacteroides abscessus subsp. abscessus]|nr:Uncharacterised protein [Mycobacteroides abscessus subsp. abscessus]